MSIEFFYDIVSPYSYLAMTQMARIADEAETEVHWRPFYLGAVFKATGNAPPALVPARG
ncbi:MAG: 2-hydroxychromene-2-carboxylate isomerase, partial [Myxococcota bacterium]